MIENGHYGFAVQAVAMAVLRYPQMLPSQLDMQQVSLSHLRSVFELCARNKEDLPLILETGKKACAAGNQHIVNLLPFWQKVLEKCTPAERYRILHQLASGHYPIEGTPSSADLAFMKSMAELAKFLRDGDKPDYLNLLVKNVDMPINEAGLKLFEPIKAVAARIPEEFSHRLRLEKIEARVDS